MPTPHLQQLLQTGLAHHQAGQLPQAEAIYRKVLAQSPGHPKAMHLLGVLAGQVGQVDLAIEMIGQAAKSEPDSPQIFSDLGVFLMESGRADEAIVACRRAIQLKSDLAAAHGNLGAALTLKRDYPAAVEACRHAIELSPSDIHAYLNLASALRGLAKYDEAIQTLRQALVHKPDHAECHYKLGWLLILTGDLKAGWPELEWRNELGPKHWSRKPQVFTQPRWDGGDLAGRTILLHAEQGFGDTLQFVRYVPLVVGRGGSVILQCQPELLRLLDRFPGAAKVISTGQPLPPFDLHSPLGRLPMIFQTDLTSIPPAEPFIRPDTRLIDAWEKRLGLKLSRLRVGLTWNSSPTLQALQHRSMSLRQLAALADLKGIEFFSLQKGPGAEQLQELAAVSMKNYMADVVDFADTAALISQLDLVISVDTSVAHLAAAMGKPTWLMLSFAADWRWLLARDDSPWYPTMRIFRQRSPGDWGSVVDQVVAALSERIDEI